MFRPDSASPPAGGDVEGNDTRVPEVRPLCANCRWQPAAAGLCRTTENSSRARSSEMDIEVDGGGSFEVGRWQASVVELPVGSLIAGRLNTNLRAKQSKSKQTRAEQNSSPALFACPRLPGSEARNAVSLCEMALVSSRPDKATGDSDCFPPSGPDR